MSNLECPVCKQSIDGDSLYCDQCGAQIFICSVCGRAGKGKRCIFDGKEMIVPGGQASSTEHVAQAPVSPVTAQTQPAQSQAQPVQSQTVQVQQAAPVPAAGKIKLTAQTHGIVIEINEDVLLGRTKGTYAAVLGRFSHISGSHCQIKKTNSAWSITDLGSTNGTFVNGVKINPNSSVSLANGAKVKLADIEFSVSMETAESGTQRI